MDGEGVVWRVEMNGERVVGSEGTNGEGVVWRVVTKRERERINKSSLN